MQFAPYIKPGDTLGIVSTASVIESKAVLSAADLLRKMGYNVILGEHVFSKHKRYAGTDCERAKDLQKMLDNPEIKALICSRGGYGTLRTLENISWEYFVKNPKWIIGFSDVTVLHSKLNTLRIASVHGVMPRYFIQNNKVSNSFEYMLEAITGKELNYNFATNINNRYGDAAGELVGGNLSVLYSLRGTSLDIDTHGKILFIEDLNEHLYHLDRIMMNLKTGGKLQGLSALVVGSFNGMKDNNDDPFGKSVEEIIIDAVSGYDYPVVFDFPAGHQSNNFALKLGCKANLIANDKLVTLKQ
jgi:muramoyltetrapeptide carboxypeptidase